MVIPWNTILMDIQSNSKSSFAAKMCCQVSNFFCGCADLRKGALIIGIIKLVNNEHLFFFFFFFTKLIYLLMIQGGKSFAKARSAFAEKFGLVRKFNFF